MLASLTGKDAGDWDITLDDEENINVSADVSYSSLSQLSPDELKKTGSSSTAAISTFTVTNGTYGNSTGGDGLLISTHGTASIATVWPCCLRLTPRGKSC